MKKENISKIRPIGIKLDILMTKGLSMMKLKELGNK
jgi:hypothetical protein